MIIPTLLPLVAIVGAAIIPLPPASELTLDTRAALVPSPNKTCGVTGAGANNGYTCLGDSACCSQFGYCGTGDSFCLTSAGCQTRYSNTTTACAAPRSGVTVTQDGTCGSTGAGKVGYRCAATGNNCCSAA